MRKKFVSTLTVQIKTLLGFWFHLLTLDKSSATCESLELTEVNRWRSQQDYICSGRCSQRTLSNMDAAFGYPEVYLLKRVAALTGSQRAADFDVLVCTRVLEAACGHTAKPSFNSRHIASRRIHCSALAVKNKTKQEHIYRLKIPPNLPQLSSLSPTASPCFLYWPEIRQRRRRNTIDFSIKSYKRSAPPCVFYFPTTLASSSSSFSSCWTQPAAWQSVLCSSSAEVEGVAATARQEKDPIRWERWDFSLREEKTVSFNLDTHNATLVKWQEAIGIA